MTRDQIVAAARRYKDLNPAWRHKGRTETQLDCVGLIWRIQHVDFGIETPDIEDYSRFDDRDRLATFLKQNMTVRRGAPAKGAVAVFNESARPCHVGIIGEMHGQLTLIHASAPRRGMHEEYLDDYWRRSLRMTLDFRAVED